MNFLKKIKNNKGSAESAMFVLGIAIFAIIVVFAMDLFGLTWQRYLSTRELSNMSRLYAIRASDLYINDQASGTASSLMTQPNNSTLGKEMMSIMNMISKHGKMDKATLMITNQGGVELLRITAGDGAAQLTAVGYDVFKSIEYGDILFAELKVEYKHHGFSVGQKNRGVAKVEEDNSEYSIKNKFAFEQFAHDSEGIG